MCEDVCCQEQAVVTYNGGSIRKATFKYLSGLEDFPDAWRTRRAINAKEAMGFQVLGVDLNLGASTCTRPSDKKIMEIRM